MLIPATLMGFDPSQLLSCQSVGQPFGRLNPPVVLSATCIAGFVYDGSRVISVCAWDARSEVADRDSWVFQTGKPHHTIAIVGRCCLGVPPLPGIRTL
jgi:hypothetical protein